MGKKRALTLIGMLVIILGAFGIPNAEALVGITGYDVLNADVAGTGGWNYSYTGTVTSLGGSLRDLTGGTGTMADGVYVGTGTSNTQLFSSNVNQTIKLYLDDYYFLNTINFYGGDHGTGNSIPGAINGMDITIGSTTQTFATTGFGPSGSGGNLINDSVDLFGTGLASLSTNQVVLTNITASSTFNSYTFSIAEIMIDGTLAGGDGPAVPEPATMLLFGSGLLGAFVRRRKQS